MKRSPRLTQGFTRTLNPKLERFIRVKPDGRLIDKKSPHWDPKTASGLNALRSLQRLLYTIPGRFLLFLVKLGPAHKGQRLSSTFNRLRPLLSLHLRQLSQVSKTC